METLRARRRALKAGLPLEALGDPEDIVAAAADERAAEPVPAAEAVEPAVEPAPEPEHVAEDAAFLMANLHLRDALEVLAHRGKDGELEQTRWRRMLRISEYGIEDTIDALSDGGLIAPCDHEEHAWYWEITPRGRAALAAVEPEITKEDRARRHLGPLTYADLWAHDCLIDKGPLAWTAWAAEAEPHLYRAKEQAWQKSGKAIRHGNYCPPPRGTAFAKSVFKLIKRGFVARRKDGTYASLRPMILKPEADMCE
jgi:DNA-binding MarR family transcriptional regulator